jgi:hypothetical protein
MWNHPLNFNNACMEKSVSTNVAGLGTIYDVTSGNDSTHFSRCLVFRTRITDMGVIFLYIDFINVTRNYTFKMDVEMRVMCACSLFS